MEVLVKYENGFRFAATCREHTVTTGQGDDGDKSRDGMWPAQLFGAAIGMCIGGYVAKFCKEHDIPHDDMTIELSRRLGSIPSEGEGESKRSITTRLDAKIRVGAELSDEQQRGILEAADNCHITNSIKAGMDIVCSLAGANDQ